MSRLLSSLIMDVDDRLLLLPGLEEQLLEAGPVCPLLHADEPGAQLREEARLCVTPRPPSTLIGSSHLLSGGPCEAPPSLSGGDSLADTIDLAQLVDELMGNSMDGLPCIHSLLELTRHGTQDDATELGHTEEESPFDVGVSALFPTIEDMDLMELPDLGLLDSSSWMGPTSPVATSQSNSSISSNNSALGSSNTDSDTVSTIEVSRHIDSDSNVNANINNSSNIDDVSEWISQSDLQSQFAKCSSVVVSGASQSYDPCSSSGYSSDTSDQPDSQMPPGNSVISSSSSNDIASSGAALLEQQLLTVAATALSGGCERRLRKKQQNQRAAVRYRQRKRTEHDTLKGMMSGEQARNRQLRERVDAIGKELLYLRGLLKELYGTSLPKLPDGTHKGT